MFSLISKFPFLSRGIALYLAIQVLFSTLLPSAVYALTEGPSQPEVQSFEPMNATEMVNLFSGDFTYNIPLFELPGPHGGYPFNMAYNAGIGMDQEASWVGLGWNLNPGAISRNMRGLPDDFSGDKIEKEEKMKDNISLTVGAGTDLELFGISKKKALNLSLGLDITFNNYKGVSSNVSVGFGSGFKGGKIDTKGLHPGFSLSLNMNSASGASIVPSLSLSHNSDKNMKSFNLGTSINSRQGLTGLTLGYSGSRQWSKKNKKGVIKNFNSKIAASAPLSLIGGNYMPSAGMPSYGGNVNFSVKLGAGLPGAFPNASLKSNINYEIMGGKQSIHGYGYLNLQNSNQEEDLLDNTREKDGILIKSTEFLCNPALSYDIYSVNGQGMSAMYRPFRQDIGVVGDRKAPTILGGGSAGFELAKIISPPGVRLGADFTVNYHKSYSTKEKTTPLTLGFKQAQTNSLFEPVYFKVYGESTTDKGTLNNLLGDKPMRLSINQDQFVTDGSSIATNTILLNQGRESKNTVVQPLTNKQITNKQNPAKIIVKEYDIQYIQNGTSKTLNRNIAGREQHTAGFTVMNPDGLRYVYALPAYNKTQVETQFSTHEDGAFNIIENPTKSGSTFSHSANNTDRYLSRTVMPAYAHSYLLTAILGSDYIDVDGTPGPSDGDFGYWVKFEYELAEATYQWRAPFYGANFNRGLLNKKGDNKGSYLYGEKELWYLSKAETQSHIAVFKTSNREDSRGAKSENQTKDDAIAGLSLGGYAKKLDKIELYSKPEFALGTYAKPIVTAHFEYSYGLCKKVANNGNTYGSGSLNSSGKLTLKKVWFTHQKNERGKLSPYQFDYHENVSQENPDYDGYAYDRWGNYKPYPPTDQEQNLDFPYVNQKETPANRNLYAAVWSLKEITLPSGGKIVVDYESDDYAYVHNETAMKMTAIKGLEGAGNFILKTKADTDEKRRVYFDLDQSIPTGSITNTEQEAAKYIKPGEQLFFKIQVGLTNTFTKEWISGYAKVTRVNLVTPSAGAPYTQGYVELELANDYHPFCVAAWQHLQQAQPEIIRPGLTAGGIDDVGDVMASLLDIIPSILSAISTIEELFGGFYAYCSRKNFGTSVEPGKAWIRLNVTNKIKYGGGVRVKKVVLYDKWQVSVTSTAQQSIYGQVYEYTKKEDGKLISSGVASYEPMLGGEEIPLRKAHWYSKEMILASDITYYFEGPINEGLYPGAQVGYSEVTVRSLAAAAKDNILDAPTNSFLANYFPNAGTTDFATTGIAVHEFYTTKDFPVYSRHTKVDKKSSPLLLKALALLGWSDDYMHATQGYVTELNDMNGKPKKVSYFAQETVGGVTKKSEVPVSWVQYNYKSKPLVDVAGAGQKNGYVLTSEVEALVSDDGHTAVTEQRTLGVDYDLFVDDREHFSISASNIGFEFGLDIFFTGPIPVMLTYPWPALPPQIEKQRVTTKVTNKIIHRTGILESVEAFDGTSVVKTDNLLWDAQTGEVVLTSVNNNFDDKIYTYNIPAHLKYRKMGAAYTNTGLLLADRSINNLLNKGIELSPSPAPNPDNSLMLVYQNNLARSFAMSNLEEGDELIVFESKTNGNTVSDEMLAPISMVTVGKMNNNIHIYPTLSNSDNLVGKKVWLYVYRSGKRNMLSAKVGHITALTNPVTDRTFPINCEKTFVVPKDCGN